MLNGAKRIGRSAWVADVPTGSLVKPVKNLLLTPLGDDEVLDWPEWNIGELGIVLPPEKNQVGVLVLVPNGAGLCFADELRVVSSAKLRT